MNSSRQGEPARVSLAVALVVAVITAVVFAPALDNDFVHWDDDRNFLTNPNFRGLGATQIHWMFTSALTGHWIPLTWLTLGADYLLWGMHPFGYHLTNILLHAANAALFFVLAFRLLELALPGAGSMAWHYGAVTAAVAFAVHPLRAESVAWITERRDVLAGLFFLAAILAYFNASQGHLRRRRTWLIVSLSCHAFALMSKSITMTLPIVLVVLDFYPLGRLRGGWRQWTAPASRRVWTEKIPFLILSLATGVIALQALKAAHFLTPLDHHSTGTRVALAAYGFVFYLWKTVLPLGLTPLYEMPVVIDPLAPPFLWSAIVVASVFAALCFLRRRWPAGLAACAVYGAILLPVSLRVHAGHQLVADRYSYLACLGWVLLVGAAVAAIVHAVGSRRLRPAIGRLVVGATAAWLLGLGWLSTQQARVWQDTGVLWRHAVNTDPTCALCHNQLGAWLGSQGALTPALEHFERGVALRPDHGPLRLNLSAALTLLGRPAEAAAELSRLAARYPADIDVQRRLGAALALQGTGPGGPRPVEAVAPALLGGDEDALLTSRRVPHTGGRHD
jgi:hypothetical protein